MDKIYKIMLVEDSEAHKELIYRAFEDSGQPVSIEWAESLQKARSLIISNPPNIALADWRLNDGDGIELLEYSRDKFPLIIMTSFGNEELAVNSMKAGVMDYIVKSKEAFDKLPTIIMRCLREWENIVGRKLAEQAMKASEERYRLATDGANDIIWDWDIKSDFFYMSKLWGQTLEHKSTDTKMTYNEFILLLYPEDRERVENKIQEYIKVKPEYYSDECRLMLADKTVKWVHIRGKALKNDVDEVIRIAGSMTDITERKLYEKRIEEIAYKDALTGLPNRAELYDRLVELSNIPGTMKSGIFHLDIDNFKIINDLYGHRFGDRFINEIAVTLQEMSEKGWFISRSGGDEFTIIINNIDNNEKVEAYAKKIMAYINKNISVFEQNIDITCSIGICLYPDDGGSADEILRNVDMAMYKAKKEGKNRYAYFGAWMNEEIVEQVEFEQRLREAISRNEFVLYYQPQFDLLTNEFYGFEALIRWNSPIYGLVPPLKFIPVAEKTGLIVQIGLWVLKTALIFAERLSAMGLNNMLISINVSAVQLLQVDFVENFINCIKLHKTGNVDIGIEITESSMIENFETNTEKLQELKNLGLNVSLDDFGTGYSSLNYLNKLPIDAVKIDKSFIDGIMSEEKNYKLTTLIISLAHSMGLKVVAEGVESEEQKKILKNNSCDIMQGYLISKPLPEIEAIDYVINLYKEAIK